MRLGVGGGGATQGLKDSFSGYFQGPDGRETGGSFRRVGVPEFPGSSVVKILCFHCRGHGFSPWWGPHVLYHMLWSPQKRKRKMSESPDCHSRFLGISETWKPLKAICSSKRPLEAGMGLPGSPQRGGPGHVQKSRTVGGGPGPPAG